MKRERLLRLFEVQAQQRLPGFLGPSVRIFTGLESSKCAEHKAAEWPNESGRCVACNAGTMRPVAFLTWLLGLALSEECSNCEEALAVMSFNVLARRYTRHNSAFHQAGVGGVESRGQTAARHAKAAEQIWAAAPEAVLLQECGPDFLEAAQLAKYRAFRCGAEGPGAAVLLREGWGFDAGLTCLGGTEAAGGSSKSAAVVQVQLPGARLALVSVHFSHEPLPRQHLADLVSRHLQHLAPDLRVVAGDFNLEPGAELRALERSFRASRAVPDVCATGLAPDFASRRCLDHVLVSGRVCRSAVLGVPQNPWGGPQAQVTGASDHVPLMVWVAL